MGLRGIEEGSGIILAITVPIFITSNRLFGSNPGFIVVIEGQIFLFFRMGFCGALS